MEWNTNRQTNVGTAHFGKSLTHTRTHARTRTHTRFLTTSRRIVVPKAGVRVSGARTGWGGAGRPRPGFTGCHPGAQPVAGESAGAGLRLAQSSLASPARLPGTATRAGSRVAIHAVHRTIATAMRRCMWVAHSNASQGSRGRAASAASFAMSLSAPNDLIETAPPRSMTKGAVGGPRRRAGMWTARGRGAWIGAWRWRLRGARHARGSVCEGHRDWAT